MFATTLLSIHLWNYRCYTYVRNPCNVSKLMVNTKPHFKNSHNSVFHFFPWPAIIPALIHLWQNGCEKNPSKRVTVCFRSFCHTWICASIMAGYGNNEKHCYESVWNGVSCMYTISLLTCQGFSTYVGEITYSRQLKQLTNWKCKFKQTNTRKTVKDSWNMFGFSFFIGWYTRKVVSLSQTL